MKNQNSPKIYSPKNFDSETGIKIFAFCENQVRVSYMSNSLMLSVDFLFYDF